MNALVNIVKTDAAAALKTTLVVKVVLVVTDLFISYKKSRSLSGRLYFLSYVSN